MKTALEILSWSFWSPETREPAQWKMSLGAARAQVSVPNDAIPAAHRRRMSNLSKVAVQVALEAARGARPDYLVFCSQHGELTRTRELLASIVSGAELSPTSFSQSVHNTSSGLYTIITANESPATSLAAGAGTFAYGWIEAESFLEANRDKRALLVSCDEALSSEYAPYCPQEQRPHALGLLVGVATSGGITLEPSDPGVETRLPLPPLFIAWALSGGPELNETAGGQGWTWRRVSA